MIFPHWWIFKRETVIAIDGEDYLQFGINFVKWEKEAQEELKRSTWGECKNWRSIIYALFYCWYWPHFNILIIGVLRLFESNMTFLILWIWQEDLRKQVKSLQVLYGFINILLCPVIIDWLNYFSQYR